MGLLNKLKNVLFEEEEIELPIQRKEEVPEKREEKNYQKEPKEISEDIKVEKVRLDDYEKPKQMPYKEEVEEKEPTSLDVLERDIFASKKTFEFPVFDEAEFSDTANLRRNNNVLEHEKINRNRKIDFGKYDESKKVVESNFRPSPIISPVYGILDQNYKKEDLVPKKKVRNEGTKRAVDIDQIRNKAYGTLEEEIDLMSSSPYDEEIILPDDDLEIDENNTIDDLLLDSIDESVPLKDMMDNEELEDTIDLNVKPEQNVRTRLNKTIDMLDEIEEEMSEDKKIKDDLNDTIESDLFDLIDSMYETREGGE